MNIMGTIDTSQYKTLYIQAAKSYFNQIDSCVAALRANANDATALQNLHIAFHSLKGQNFAMGFTDLANTCLEVEHVCKNAMEKKIPVSPAVLAEIDEALPILKKAVTDYENSPR